jgi:branched-chain amino acid transport system substrate-binding protein
MLLEQYVNGHGGVASLGGAKINLIFEDSAGVPSRGATAATKLITQDHVVALLGAFHSGVTGAIAAVAEQQQIPFVNPDSTDPTLVQHGYKWFFRTTPDDSVFVPQFFQFLSYLHNTTGVSLTTVGLVNQNSEFGNFVNSLELNLTKRYGYQVVANLPFNTGQTDVTALVLKLISARPDVVFMTPEASDAILFVKTFARYNFTAKIFISDDSGFVDPSFAKTLGSDANYLFTRDVFSADLSNRIPQIKNFSTTFQNTYGYLPTGTPARAYVGSLVLVDAIQRAGSLTPDALRNALASTSIPSSQIPMPWEGVKFNSVGQNTLGQGVIEEYINGTERTVWPLNYATTKPVFPFPGWPASS